MVYAKIHDHTVAEDYYTAMEQIEQRLNLADMGDVKVPKNDCEQLSILVEQLIDSSLSSQERLDVIDQMRFLVAQESVLE